MPPFEPPYGSRSSAHFHVIHDASAAHSPSDTLCVVADAALRRAEHRGVLHAVAGEDLDRAVVATERHRDHQRSLGIAQPLGHQLRDVCVRQRLLVLGARHQEERRVPFQRLLERRYLEGQGRRSLGRRRAEGAGEALAHARDGGRGQRLAENARQKLGRLAHDLLTLAHERRVLEEQGAAGARRPIRALHRRSADAAGTSRTRGPARRLGAPAARPRLVERRPRARARRARRAPARPRTPPRADRRALAGARAPPRAVAPLSLRARRAARPRRAARSACSRASTAARSSDARSASAAGSVARKDAAAVA